VWVWVWVWVWASLLLIASCLLHRRCSPLFPRARGSLLLSMRVDFNQKFARPGVPHKHMPEPKPVNDKLLLRHMQRSVYVCYGFCCMSALSMYARSRTTRRLHPLLGRLGRCS